MRDRATRIVTVGVSYKTAHLDLLETLSRKTNSESLRSNFPSDRQQAFALLSTCNRIEIYAVTQDTAGMQQQLAHYLTQLDRRANGHFYKLVDEEAIQHLFKVACGIDSMVVGEPQILQQVRNAEIIGETGPSRKTIEKLFQHAYASAIRIRRVTRIQSQDSIGALACQFIYSKLGEQTSVLLIGAGKNARAALASTAKYRFREVYVANRTPLKIRYQELANAKTYSLEDIQSLLPSIDAVIVATSSSNYVISRETLITAGLRRKTLLVDISMPRNIDPATAKEPLVELYNIDDLKTHSKILPESQTDEAVHLISQEASRFISWLSASEVDPVIKSIRSRAEKIRLEELDEALRRLRSGKERDERVIAVLSSRIVNRILHEPSARLRDKAKLGKSDLYGKALKELFGINE
ncbi:MAG: glutamyl-tRNA reductase [Thaumarchaeota archaeon]|nr:glutamyl-tRNA reductase [Nitrososphaerota archaeon]